jgi:Bacterial extracellular solute-binding protein
MLSRKTVHSKDCIAVFSFLAVTSLGFLLSCKSKPKSAGEVVEAPINALELVLTYGSEKEKWINEVTATFNRDGHRTSTGKPIFVRAIPMGSGEAIDEVLEGRRQPHIISPASAAFIRLGNAQSQSKLGKDLIGSTDNLVLSPVVIAMWKPMAEAIGWGSDLKNGEETESLRQSKTATLAILKKRLATMGRKKQTMAEIESDLTRIDNQIDLILENATVQGKPQTISADIELASDLLGGAVFEEDESAISDLEQTYGQMQKPKPQKEMA